MKLGENWIYALFGAFFMGIFTLQVVFFLLFIARVIETFSSGTFDLKTWIKRDWPMWALVLTMLISACWRQSQGGEDFGYHWGMFAIWLFSSDQVKKLNWRRLHQVMLIASVPGLIYSVYWLLRPAEIEWAQTAGFAGYPRAAGFLSNPITHAEGLALVLAWSLARLQGDPDCRERRLILVHGVLSFLIILFSRVRSGLVGFAFLILLHALLSPRHRKLAVGFVLVFGVGFLVTLSIFGFNWASIEERFMLLQHSWRLFLEHPWLGIGPDRYREFPIEDRPGLWAHPHNTLVGMATELGLLGLSAFLIKSIWIAKNWLRLRGRQPVPVWVIVALGYALSSYWLFGLFDFNFHDTELLIIHAAHWCLLLRLAYVPDADANAA